MTDFATDLGFPNIRGLQSYLAMVLSSTSDATSVTPEDEKIILALIERHPDRDKIKGAGITAVAVYHNGDSGFLAQRKDGSTFGFDYKPALYSATVAPPEMEKIVMPGVEPTSSPIMWTGSRLGFDLAITPTDEEKVEGTQSISLAELTALLPVIRAGQLEVVKAAILAKRVLEGKIIKSRTMEADGTIVSS